MKSAIKLYDKNGKTINNEDKFVGGDSIFILNEEWYIDSEYREWNIDEFNLKPYKKGYQLVDFELE